MSYETTIDGGLNIEFAAGENPMTKKELETFVLDTIDESETLGDWTNLVEVLPDTEETIVDISIFNFGNEDSFGYSLETFVKVIQDKGLLCSGVISAQGEDPNDRWKIEVNNNDISYLAAEVQVTYKKVSSFREMAEGIA